MPRRLPVAPPRVVIDTNVVLSSLVFGSGASATVRLAWQHGHCVPLVSMTTVQELLRVLAYPKFRLSAVEQEQLLADYLPYTQAVRIPEPAPSVPECRDPFDEQFLHLAIAGNAKFLVTGDKDLLELGAPMSFSILGPVAFLAVLVALP